MSDQYGHPVDWRKHTFSAVEPRRRLVPRVARAAGRLLRLQGEVLLELHAPRAVIADGAVEIDQIALNPVGLQIFFARRRRWTIAMRP